MLTVFVNRKPVVGPWGGGNNFVTALFEHGQKFGVNFTADTSQNFDAILMIDPRYDELQVSANEIAAHKQAHPECPVVYRVNECDARKATTDVDPMIVSMSSFVDHFVFVSGWLRHYFFERGLDKVNASVIYNGVNKSHFYAPPKGRETYVAHLTKRPRVVTHHWSNNPLKGFDIYDALDEAAGYKYIDFTYVGRDRGTFKHTKVIQPLSGKQLGNAIRDHDVYVSASRWDPGPNHCIEAIASGLPILAHYDGGGAAEFAGHYDCVYEDVDDLMQRLSEGRFFQSPIVFDEWQVCVEKFCVLLRSLVANQLPKFQS